MLVVQQAEGKAPVVTVVPITHSPHRNPDATIEIPPAIKRHLGLDDQPSWIVLDDFNVFTWPGYDLRPVPGQNDRYHYGLMPPRLFASIVRKFPNFGVKAKVLALRVTMRLFRDGPARGSAEREELFLVRGSRCERKSKSAGLRHLTVAHISIL